MCRKEKLGKWETSDGCRIIQVVAGRSNAFLVTKGGKNILLDTSSRRMGPILARRLSELKVDHIDFLILTHSHVDHAGNAAWIREKFNPLIFIHKKEARFLETGDNIIPGGTIMLTRFLVKHFGKRYGKTLRYTPCNYDVPLSEEYDLQGHGFNARILPTPGHTQGSVSLIVNNEVALVGDTLFGILRWSVFPPYACDPEEMIRSWGLLLETPCSVFVPSHGRASSRDLLQKDYNRRIRRQKKRNNG